MRCAARPSGERQVVRDDWRRNGRSGDAGAERRRDVADRRRCGPRADAAARSRAIRDERLVACRRPRGSDSPGRRAAGRAEGLRPLGPRHLVRDRPGLLQQLAAAPRAAAAGRSSAAASAAVAVVARRGVQAVAAGHLVQPHAASARGARRRRRAPRATTARAPPIGNGGSSTAWTTMTSRGAAAPTTTPIVAVAARRGTWLQRSTQPSQPVP